ncbi:MAG: hypothetical protein ACREC0_14135 [Methylocella sp.]
MLALIHVFLDNARCHHARLVREWLARPSCRIRLLMSLPNDHPGLLPLMNPSNDEPDRAVMGPHAQACHAQQMLRDMQRSFLRDNVPKNWADFCDSVTDNFRVISPKDFRVLT